MPVLTITSPLAAMTEERHAQLRDRLPGWTVLAHPTEAQLQELVSEIEICLGRLPTELISRANALRWVQLPGAGANNPVEQLLGPEVQISNASGVHAIQISEHILMLMLALCRHLPEAIAGQTSATWGARPAWEAVSELHGARALLIGTGAIGQHFARLATALGMEVVGVRRHPERGGDAMLRVVGPDLLVEELSRSDWVVLTVPLTAETAGMLGERELSALKPGARVINIGRGGTIDQEALLQGLRDGRVGGAGLDVCTPEPLPPQSPLWGMPNVIITSHYSGSSPHYATRLWKIFDDNLGRYLDGRPLRNLVDRQLGY